MHEEFKGHIGRTVEESRPSWPEPSRPAAESPNVVVILLDDTGFAHLGCYGSSIDTPRIDALAAAGLRYTNFHATSLCSPTRASLLTGRNHHSVGMRAISNWNSGFPHMRGYISRHAYTLAEVLRAEGYGTFAVGKWHLAPTEQCSGAGPFDHWPLQRGFDRFYGFLPGTTDQFFPELTVDNHHIDPPSPAEAPYHLTEDLVEQAIAMVREQKSVLPQKPFFLYLTPAATHNPHQAPEEYIRRYRGRFDDGWDVVRQSWFERQKQLGIVPPATKLAPRNPGVEPWESLSRAEQQLAARLQEAFAGFLEHTDAQIGRLVDFLDDIGELENTLLLLASDNGSSQEGGPTGSVDERRQFSGLPPVDPDAEDLRLDELGSWRSHTNIPWGWAQVGNTPLKWYKQNTHGGGVRVPLIVHWPAGQLERGGIRHQFHHVSDVAPTVLDLLNLDSPRKMSGVDQLPLAGVSLAYSFREATAETAKQVQYFEMLGDRAIWQGGWKAVSHHTPGTQFDDDSWELYHLEEDFSESDDLSESNPDKLREMVERWWVEAGRHGVLPLDDRRIQLFDISPPGVGPHAANSYRYLGPLSHMPTDAAPPLGRRDFQLTAEVDRPTGHESGVLLAQGTINAGVVVFVQDGLLKLVYNAFGRFVEMVSEAPLPEGRSAVKVQLRRDTAGGSVRMEIDGRPAGAFRSEMLVPMRLSIGTDIGKDRGSPICEAYEAPFAFSGRLMSMQIDLLGEDARAEASMFESEMVQQ